MFYELIKKKKKIFYELEQAQNIAAGLPGRNSTFLSLQMHVYYDSQKKKKKKIKRVFFVLHTMCFYNLKT